MAGFRREDTRSKAGRLIKPSPKVRQIMCDSLRVAVDEAFEEVDEGRRRIRYMLEEDAPPPSVEREYRSWNQQRQELDDLLDEANTHLPGDDLAAYRQHYDTVVPQWKQLASDVSRCVRGGAPLAHDSDVQNHIDTLRHESGVIDQEIRDMQEAIARSMQTVTLKGANRAPRDPQVPTPTAPPTLQVTQSTAPVRPRHLANSTPLTAPLGGPPPDLSRVTTGESRGDATAAALDRLASVLENKQHSGGRLPKIEPEVFKGDLTAFPAWWNAFETMVESRTHSEPEKLFFLNKFTSGPANGSIKGFLGLYTDDGAYRRARNVILTRYGNRLRIAEAFKARLSAWSVVKDGDGAAMQAFADFLWQCNAAMSSLDYLTNLSCQEENVKLANKLPRVVIERWDRQVDEAMYGEDLDVTEEPSDDVGHFPSFPDFCRFVSREARILVGSCVKGSPAVHGQRRKATALSTDARQREPTRKGAAPHCEFCKQDHWLYQCTAFLANRTEFKRQYARDKGLCFGCLRRNHVYRTCRIRNPELMKEPEGFQSQPAPRATSLFTRGDDSAGYSSSVVPVRVFLDENHEHQVLVYALLDSQSSSCFISNELADRLQLEPEPVKLELTTLGSRKYVNSGVVGGLRVCQEIAGESIALPRCYTRAVIPGCLDHVPDPEKVARWPHLAEVAAELRPPRAELMFGLLIGFNCSAATCVEQTRRADREQPYAVKTVLGWTVTGCLAPPPPRTTRCLSLQTRIREVNCEQIRQAFDQGFEEPSPAETTMSQDDARFMRIVREEMVLLPEGRFQVPLPFRELPTNLPNSRSMAFQRLMSVKRRMTRDQVFAEQYRTFMNGMIAANQAERVPADDKTPTGSCWWWSHHGVTHPRKPGKMRGVFDGAAEVAGVSINSKLLTGPDVTSNLVGVISRFRREKVAITCDIEGMFLQVSVAPRYRDYLRFLWFAEGDPTREIIEYRMCVNLFGAASSPGTSALALKETANLFEQDHGAAAADFVRDDFYVDDGLGATPDDDSALELVKNSRALCARGGFNLHKFASSSREVMSKIPEAWRAPSLKKLEIKQDHLPNERALGLLMSLEKDALLYEVQLLTKADTRRGYLSALSSVFDPLGLVSAALLPGRLLLQELCAQKFGWDDEVSEQTSCAWREWYTGLADLNELCIPRCARRTVELPLVRVELHTFSDASSRGYGAGCYLLLGDAHGHVDTTLMFAKARVAPSKTTTVPRLELQAAVLAVKMGQFLSRELRYPDVRCHYWTDSTVVLGYITNESRRFHVYVANRSQYIRTHTKSEQWHHIATGSNPADIASRGLPAADLVTSDLWWNGPDEILGESLAAVEVTEIEPTDPELRQRATVMTTMTQPRGTLSIMTDRCSTWHKLRAVMSACLRVAEMARRGKSSTGVAELSRAEARIVTLMQEERLKQELTMLKGEDYPTSLSRQRERKTRLRPSSNLYRLDVFCDTEGTLRVGGRLRMSGWPQNVVHPAVLPGDHPAAVLLIEHYHVSGGHMGAVTTLNSVRQAGYWILGGRAAIARVVIACVVCRRKRGTVGEQHMADLPEDRLSTEPPFTYVAADMFGPFLIRQGRSQVKWWICVFVCMASRAIHLEPVGSMDVSGFLQAYRRLVARRGPVRSLRCDRGTNFTGAENELARAWTETERAEIETELKKRKCDLLVFKFNPPKASHMAGSWERMIRTVRSAFWETLKKYGASLSYEVFSTLAAESEALVNSRPLTVVDMNDDTTPAALTPAQLLTMKPATLAPPPGEFVPEDRYVRRRWRATQYLANQFWRRWVREYALAQQQRVKWNRVRDDFRPDDIVLLVEPDIPRGKWPLARVLTVSPSDDALVRKVRVKTSTNELDRPIQKLVLVYRPMGSQGPEG